MDVDHALSCSAMFRNACPSTCPSFTGGTLLWLLVHGEQLKLDKNLVTVSQFEFTQPTEISNREFLDLSWGFEKELEAVLCLFLDTKTRGQHFLEFLM